MANHEKMKRDSINNNLPILKTGSTKLDNEMTAKVMVEIKSHCLLAGETNKSKYE